MATIVTRSGKGSPLTHAEVDSNFTNLNTDKLELSGGTMTGNLSFGDDDKAIFGAGSDLQIYHDGAHSYISEVGQGNMRIVAANFELRNSGNTERMILAEPDAGVALYYDNAEKIATTSTGVDITGTLTSDGLTVDGQGIFQTSTGASLLTLKSTDSSIGGGESIQMDWVYGDTANSTSWRHLSRYAGNQFQWFSNIDDAGYNLRMNLYEGGDFALYEDTGTTAKFFWDASGESLGIGTTSPISGSLHLAKSGTSDYTNMFFQNTGASGRNYQLGVGGSNTGNYAGKFYIYDSTAGQPRFSLDSSGNVGIGTLLPSAKLHVEGTSTVLISLNNTLQDARIELKKSGTQYGQVSVGTNQMNLVATGASTVMRFVNNAGEAARIDSSGNVGIGTSSPSSFNASGNDLVVGNGVASNDTGITIHTNSNATGHLLFADGTSGSAAYAGYIRYSHASDFMAFHTNAGSERMRIDSSGNVGIGTSSPIAILDVKNATNEHIVVSGSSAYGSNAIVGVNDSGGEVGLGLGGNTVEFYTAATERMRITSSGDVAVGTATALGTSAGRGNITINGSNDSILSLGNGGSLKGYILQDSGGMTIFSDGATYQRFYTNSLERMRIDSSGQVGIGTSSPNQPLHVIGNTQSTGSFLAGSSLNAATPDYTFLSDTSLGMFRLPNVLGFSVAGSETMRIDSSGNLLVGTTDTTLYNNTSGGGAMLSNSGCGFAKQTSGTGDPVVYFNNTGDDGQILDFRKDGTTVGSIGASANILGIVGKDGNGGLAIQNNSFGDIIYPASNSYGGASDNAIDLGYSSGRWKDLYLSGGVYLGGTAAANKLDDYEEGTWTPSYAPNSGAFSTLNYSSQSGYYVKVGSLVYVYAVMSTSSVALGTASGALYISGLPFAAKSGTSSHTLVPHFARRWNLTTDEVLLNGNLSTGSTSFQISKMTMNSVSTTTSVQVSEMYVGTGGFRNEYYFSGSYRTD